VIVRSLLLSLLAAAALALSACGGGGGDSNASVAEYTASVTDTRDRVDFALARITKGTKGDTEEFLNRMEEAAAVIDDAASDLGDADVAEGYADETERLTTALHQLAVDLRATAHDLGQPELGSIIPTTQGLNFESWDQANLALATLQADGLKVELIGRH
jgi:hypothetical protein